MKCMSLNRSHAHTQPPFAYFARSALSLVAEAAREIVMPTRIPTRHLKLTIETT